MAGVRFKMKEYLNFTTSTSNPQRSNSHNLIIVVSQHVSSGGSRPSDKGEGGGGGWRSSRPNGGAGFKKNIQIGLKIRWGGGGGGGGRAFF